MPIFTKSNSENAYDNSTYGSDNANYHDILVGKLKDHPEILDLFIKNDILDPENNYTVGTKACSTVNLCVPAIYVPKVTRNLVDESVYDKDGKPSDSDYKTAEELHKLADSLKDIPDSVLLTSSDFQIGKILFTPITDITTLGYTQHKAKDVDKFSDLASTNERIITNDNVTCRPETKYELPTPKPLAWETKEFDDLKKQIQKLMDDDTDLPTTVNAVSNEALTERRADGHGVFDWISSSMLSHLNDARDKGLVNNEDIGQMLLQLMIQNIQVSTQFVLERDKTVYMNLLQMAQIKAANVQALVAKAELLMLPSKLELAYAELEAQKKQVELLQLQIEQQKLQIPKEAAQLDQIREQTSLICVQRKQAMEQLAQAELDRKLKQVQIESGIQNIKATDLDIKIKEQQANQSEIATQTALVQLDGAKEDVKLKNTQWQMGLEQIKAVKVQIKQITADIKIKAQQLLKDKEQTNLLKAQTASMYAQVTATTEAIRAAKAQYCDTIDGQPIGGVLGAQITVNKMQAEAFNRDSFYKLFNVVKDGWTAKKTADVATLSPNGFTAIGVDRVLIKYMEAMNIPADILNLPYNYTDYLSDDAMDGKVATPSSSNSTVR